MSADLSVILAAPGGRAGIAETLRHLRAQTARARIELVIVSDAVDPELESRADSDGFAGLLVVHLAPLRSRAEANAAGFRASTGAVVAFAEDHCFPEPDWAEALLRRHEEPWAGVAPELANANPESLIGWCDFLLNYAPWAEPTTGGEIHELPGHNTSYKRTVLDRRAGDLAIELETESELHRAVIASGGRLYLEPEAKARHRNIARPGAWLAGAFHGGRLYAWRRARDWRTARRLLYAAAWPGIAAVRFTRLCREWPAAAPARARLAPVALVGLLFEAAGQALGYVAGPGHARAHMARIDFGRARDAAPPGASARSLLSS